MDSNSRMNTVEAFLEIAFYVFPYLCFKDILKCRLLSKSLKKLVNTFVQHMLDQISEGKLSIPPCDNNMNRPSELWRPKIFTIYWRIDKSSHQPRLKLSWSLLSQRSGLITNQKDILERCGVPLYSRNICLRIHGKLSAAELEPFLSSFKIFGKNILHLNIQFEPYSNPDAFNCIARFLHCCPNLQRLKIELPFCLHVEVKIEKLECFLPHLPFLKFLEIKNQHRTDIFYVNFTGACFNRYKDQLKGVNFIDRFSHLDPGNSEIMMSTLLEANFLLTTLCIDTDSGEITNQLLKSYSKTLRQVYIKFDRYDHYTDPLEILVGLPNLRLLRLKNYFLSLNFLENVPNVSKLILVYSSGFYPSKVMVTEKEKYDIFSLASVKNGLLRSNVWTLCKRLDTISIKVHQNSGSKIISGQYTRKMHKWFHKYDIQNEVAEPALTQLPPELWNAVFSKLADVKDLWNVRFSYTTWHGMLKPFRSSWMFPLIFKHLAPYLLSENIRETLSYRKVCRNWKNAVDKYLGKPESKLPFTMFSTRYWEKTVARQIVDRIVQFNIRPFNIEAKEKLFQMGLHSRNPFIGRSVLIPYFKDHVWLQENNEDITNQEVLDRLSLFGKHIRHLTIEIPWIHEKFLQFLENCLKVVPNLTSLRILGSSNYYRGRTERKWNCEQFRKLSLLPNLVTLEIIELQNISYKRSQMGSDHTLLFAHIISEYATQIQRLEVVDWRPEYPVNFPKLEEFHMENYASDRLPIAKVRKLVIYGNDYIYDVGALANHFGKTIEQLLIINKSDGINFGRCDLDMPTLCCPVLRNFQLKRFIPKSLNFLTNLIRLECLLLPSPTMAYQYFWEDRVWNEAIDLFDFEWCRFPNQPIQNYPESKTVQSNIWKVFPKLKVIIFDKQNKPHQHYYYRDDVHRICDGRQSYFTSCG